MKKERLEALEKLEKIMEGANKRLVISDLVASKSGMSRTFNIYATKDNQLYNITYLVAKLIGATFTNKGKIRMYGCGMDMVFETLYEINTSALYLRGKEYEHDLAYDGLVNTNYDLI